MKINSINNSTSFGRFYVTNKGSQTLARNFIHNPEEEKYFVEKIINPLEKSPVSVIYDGYSALFQGNDGIYYNVVKAYEDGREALLTAVGGRAAYVRQPYYLPEDKEYAPRRYPEIEMARDIALHIEKSRENFEEVSAKMKPRKIEITKQTDSLAEKSALLFDMLS